MDALHQFDRTVISLISKLPNWSRRPLTVVTFIGSPIFTALVLAGMLVVTYLSKNTLLLWRELALLALLPLAASGKLLTQRARPKTVYVERMRFKTYSFPSGHSYASLVVFGLLASIVAVRMGVIGQIMALALGGLIFLVGLSRVYLGAHFPSDVIGGWFLGGLILFMVLKFMVKL